MRTGFIVFIQLRMDVVAHKPTLLCKKNACEECTAKSNQYSYTGHYLRTSGALPQNASIRQDMIGSMSVQVMFNMSLHKEAIHSAITAETALRLKQTATNCACG